jgi:glycosyltransferase involved in cell wall biosynthesis
MKIIIDLQSCQGGSSLGGIGRYSLQLSKAIVQVAHNHDVWILLNNQLPQHINFIKKEFSNLLPQTRIISFESLNRVGELHADSISRVRTAELMREKYLADLNPDLVFITSLFEGLGDDVVTSVNQISSNYKTAVILYDLIPLVQKERYLVDKITFDHYMRKLDNLKRADVLLAISEFSRDEGCSLLDYPAEKIINMSSAIGNFFRSISISTSEKESIFSRFNLSKKILMYTGSFDQRKNHKVLIEGFSKVPKFLRSEYQLVIVGNGHEDIYTNLTQHAITHGLERNDIVFTGHIDDDTLLKLYNLCYLLVFPSLCEGFGLPILEAMSCGVPAIGSNCTSIPEVIGRSDALFDPTSSDSLANKLSEVLKSPSFYQDLKHHAELHSKNFSWQRSAQIAINVFEELFNESKNNQKTISKSSVSRNTLLKSIASTLESNISDNIKREYASTIAVNEFLTNTIGKVDSLSPLDCMKESIGLITTWNTKCGIATYSKYLMRAFPIPYHVFAPNSCMLVQADEDFVTRCWNVEEDDLNHLLSKIIEQHISCLIIQFNYGFFNFISLSNFIDELQKLGVSVYVELHSTVDPPEHISNKKLSELADVLDKCTRLLVHSDSDVKRLNKIGLSFNTFILPHGVNQPIPSNLVTFHKEKGDFVIASYGYFLPHKGLLELITAFYEMSVNQPDIKLLLVNAEYPVPESVALIIEAQNLVNNFSMQHRVTFITEYLSDEESIGYLKKADLIVYPYQKTGESSSAAVRLGLATKIPVAVTPLEIFSNVCDSVHFLPGTKISNLVEGLTVLKSKILQQNPKLDSVRKNCERWLSVYDYTNITKQLYRDIFHDYTFKSCYPTSVNYYANEPSLLTIIGDKQYDGIYSNGKEGMLVHGPYITLQIGHFQLYIYGHYVNKGDGLSFQLKHTNGESAVLHSEINLGHRKYNVLLAVEFFLQTEVNQFEIQLINSKDCDVVISNIVICGKRIIH